MRGRLAKDDFVVDDGVGGYTDNGMDDFEENGAYAESEDEDHRSKRESVCRAISLRYLTRLT